MSSTNTAIRRGRRRDDSVDAAICGATLALLASDGYAQLTMGSVIARAGVSSATLYRRWPTKDHLVAAAIDTVSTLDLAIDTGSLQGDLASFISVITDAGCSDPASLSEDVLIELGRNAELYESIKEKILAPRIAALGDILDRAESKGELPRGVDRISAYSVVIGPVHHHSTVMGQAVTPELVAFTARAACAALGALGA